MNQAKGPRMYSKPVTVSSVQKRAAALESDGKVRTVEQYLGQVDQLFRRVCQPKQQDGCLLWFRGVKSTTYDLVPSIGREPNNPKNEIVYLSQFRSLAYPYLDRVPYFPFAEDEDSYWGWLFMMQDYGVPTRLMDWSKQALVALLFAVDTSNLRPVEKTTDSVIWVLNPVKLNEAFQFYDFLKPGYIPNVTEKAVNQVFGPNAPVTTTKPVAVIGPYNNPPLIAQSGTFTVFPMSDTVVPLNRQPDSSSYLSRIVIARDARDAINEQLSHYGLNQQQLFPDLSTIATQIQKQVTAEGILTSKQS